MWEEMWEIKKRNLGELSSNLCQGLLLPQYVYNDGMAIIYIRQCFKFVFRFMFEFIFKSVMF